MLVNGWAVSVDLTDANLHVPIYPRSRKYHRFMFQIRSSSARPYLSEYLGSPWIFNKLMDVIAAHLRQRAISLFPYLDDWLIRDLFAPDLYLTQYIAFKLFNVYDSFQI